MKRLICGLAAAALLGGCANLDAADRAPRTDPVARLSASGPSPWREDFADPVLADLLAQADAGALDVKIALARLERARADADEARAQRAARLTIGLEAATGGTSFSDARRAGSPTLEGTYDIDLWGRLRHAQEAAGQERTAASADVASARLLVAAETVRAYAELRAAQGRQAGLQGQDDRARRLLVLTRGRAGEGLVGRNAIDAAALGVSRAEAERQAAAEDERLQLARLGDLVGRKLTGIAPGALPEVAAAGDVGSDAVNALPQVQAAFARLQAADARRAASVSAAMPQFSITALLGAPDASIATLLDIRGLAWAMAGSLTQQVLDGGARRARVHAASAEADVADLEYRKAVLAAWTEIRASLIAEDRARRDLAVARAAGDLARRDLAANAARRREGLVDGTGQVEAEAAAWTAESRLADTRLALVEARVRATLAMGGR